MKERIYGTKECPFLIGTQEELCNMGAHPGAYFKLNCDITVGNWSPIRFCGDFDGAGHTIGGLNTPLFSDISAESTVHDLCLAGAITVCDDEPVGSLAAVSEGSVCRVESTVYIFVMANVSSETAVGGLVGCSRGKVMDCGYHGRITDLRTACGAGAIIGRTEIDVPDGLPFMVTAHAGFAAAGGAKDRSEDNTMNNVIKAIQYGPDVVEFDIKVEDARHIGVPEVWVCHDEIDPFRNSTLPEMLRLLMGQHPRSKELGEKGLNIRVQLDSKQDGILGKIFETIFAVGFPLERIVLAGDNSYEHVMEYIDTIRASVEKGMDFWMNPDFILTYDAMNEDFDSFLARIRALGLPAFTVNTDYRLLSDAAQANLAAEGIRLSLWTLNNTTAIETQMCRGAYNVTSRLPACLEYRALLKYGVCRNDFDRNSGIPEIGR